MLSETGQLPRATPLRGRYLVHFGPLNRALRVVDALRGLWRLGEQPQPQSFSLPPVPRILVSQPGHLGDVVIATAVIEPLRALFPDCRIGFLVASWSVSVLEDHPVVDAIHVHDPALLNRTKAWHLRISRHSATRRRALREISAQGYDAAIELSFNFPNNIALLHAAGIPVRIGYTSGGGGPLLTHPLVWQHRPDWSVMRYHEASLRRLAPKGSVPPRVVRSWLPPLAAMSGSRSDAMAYTVVHMGSGGPLKEWPSTHWEELVDGLLAQGRRLVFTGSGPVESARVAALVRGRTRCEDLCSQLDWPAFVRTIADAELVIAVDSAAGHVAATFDVPTLTVAHGMTDAALYKPQSPVNAVVRHAVSCLPCYRSRGCPSMDCVRGVSARSVMDALT